jgi:hypothetical protein
MDEQNVRAFVGGEDNIKMYLKNTEGWRVLDSSSSEWK